MSTTTAEPGAREDVLDANGARIESVSGLGVLATLRRGIQLSPEMLNGVWITLGLAVLAAGGKVVVPLAVQRTIDDGILASGGPDAGRVVALAAFAAVGLVLAGVCAALVNVRLFRSTEAGLATLRTRAFRHVHDLSTLTQNTERRGALVARVTNDVDTISLFVQWGGIMLLVSVLQILVATVLMAWYSPVLTAVVWVCFVPMFLFMRVGQRKVNAAYTLVRERVGAMLGAISESVVGAETVRAYGVSERTGRRISGAVEATRRAQRRSMELVAVVFSSGVFVANLVLAVVVVLGAWLGIGGALSAGEIVAFLFLVQLFTGPVQMGTEILNEMQNAVAGWRRVIAVVETPVEVTEAPDAVDLPRGPARVTLRDVRFAYSGGPDVLHGVSLDIPARTKVAVVGQTGSGKTTIAKLVTRLMDPVEGAVELDGTDLRRVSFASLRERVVLVPQEGFLFDGTVLENAAYGLRGATDAGPATPQEERAVVAGAFAELGLTDWVDTLPDGLDTQVGQRGEALSAGERQLVAIARAFLAAPDLLVLDEATSAVDPAAEVRIARALDSLTAGRSTITIAHRLSTAEAADLVVVVDAGEIVETGPHAELVAAGGIYSRMHASWVAQTR
ncbi:ABC transporter ATP-binding protein [Myceligenerans salitolerans]|uniref:ABC transporter ATP-binding protein n=1 Tax=Myceligenerans salitolerans TaxID=1230528 RepID=A0ABS3IC28_9MICO|nr:ABC transporter ATP-binding protein [Myceligenerans salitolerans]MBO0610509.1 ABC transporter ATP-binding protein [Myceligenerans salitolerans]